MLQETQIEGLEPHTVLFDTGPDSKSLIRNIQSMQTNVTVIERVIISHWHADHTGGLISFLKYRREAANADSRRQSQVVVDVHPNRPIARGIAPSGRSDRVICRLPEDPSSEAVEAEGGIMDGHAFPHLVAGNSVYVSGEIPRVTPFEEGLLGGMRWIEDGTRPGHWHPELVALLMSVLHVSA